MTTFMDLTLAICIYNKEEWIAETLDSVMCQTAKDFRLLIIDDASTDESVGVVEQYFSQYPRQYDLIRLESNHGIGYCRYLAERKATTRYLMFLDSDDVLVPTAVAKMWQKIQSDTDLMAVGCHLAYVDQNTSLIGGGLYLGAATKEEFYEKAASKKLIFMQPTAIYDRVAALSVGGYSVEGFPDGKPRYQDFCEDLDLWTRMSDLYTEGKAIIVIPEVLAYYRKLGTGLSSNTLPMLLKMRWVKRCLIDRREGRAPLCFKDWLERYPEKDMRQLRKEAKATDYLRRGALRLHRGNPFGLVDIAYSIILKPGYFIDKLNKNLLSR